MSRLQPPAGWSPHRAPTRSRFQAPLGKPRFRSSASRPRPWHPAITPTSRTATARLHPTQPYFSILTAAYRRPRLPALPPLAPSMIRPRAAPEAAQATPAGQTTRTAIGGLGSLRPHAPGPFTAPARAIRARPTRRGLTPAYKKEHVSMKSEMLINVSQPEECRIAIVED